MKRTNKRIKGIIWTLFGIIFIAGLAIATTTISDNGSTFGGDFSLNNKDAIIRVSAESSTLYQNLSYIAGGLQINQTKPESKGGIWWLAYDNATQVNKAVGWFVCHFNSSINSDAHSHCSIETLDNTTGTPALNTKLEFNYGSDIKQTGTRLAYAKFSNIDRVIFGSGVELQSINQFDIYPNNQGTTALRINNDSNGLLISALGSTLIQIDSTDMLKLQGNTTTATCNANTAGAIYYNAEAFKHYGCNSTTWNVLY